MTRNVWAAAVAMVVASAQPVLAAPEKAAVFEFQLANLAQLPPTEADKARLPKLTDLLRKLLEDSGKYDIVSSDPVASKVKSADLRSCGGCADDYAKQLGARLAITTQIQKVSNLILNITVYIKDVEAKTPEQAYGVSIRGDTDDSFERGVKYIVDNKILAK